MVASTQGVAKDSGKFCFVLPKKGQVAQCLLTHTTVDSSFLVSLQKMNDDHDGEEEELIKF